MKRLLILFLLLIAASTSHATSNIVFSGGGYDISVLLSLLGSEDCKVIGLNVSGDNPNIISIGSLTAGVGLIGSALLSMLSAAIHQEWRRFSLVLMSASVFLFLVLLIFAKFA